MILYRKFIGFIYEEIYSYDNLTISNFLWNFFKLQEKNRKIRLSHFFTK